MNELYKITNIKTGEVIYAQNLAHVCSYLGCNPASRYSIMKNNMYKHYVIKVVNGSEVPYKNIYKPVK